MSQVDTPQSSATQPAEPKKGTPIRLILLLGILAVVLAAFLVDLFWMYDQVKAASERLQKAADEMAERPREEGKPQFLSHDEVAQAIGFAPTISEIDEEDRLIEHYRWWGSLPLKRRYIVARYKDKEGRQYSGYTISNRDIFGQDEEEAMQQNQSPASSEPVPAPVPGVGTMPPGGVTSPPVPSNEPESSDPAAEESETSNTDEEKPAEAPVKDDSNTEK
jgi:hypothetical protein